MSSEGDRLDHPDQQQLLEVGARIEAAEFVRGGFGGGFGYGLGTGLGFGIGSSLGYGLLGGYGGYGGIGYGFGSLRICFGRQH